jgi:hypothetical protein
MHACCTLRRTNLKLMKGQPKQKANDFGLWTFQGLITAFTAHFVKSFLVGAFLSAQAGLQGEDDPVRQHDS